MFWLIFAIWFLWKYICFQRLSRWPWHTLIGCHCFVHDIQTLDVFSAAMTMTTGRHGSYSMHRRCVLYVLHVALAMTAPLRAIQSMHSPLSLWTSQSKRASAMSLARKCVFWASGHNDKWLWFWMPLIVILISIDLNSINPRNGFESDIDSLTECVLG